MWVCDAHLTSLVNNNDAHNDDVANECAHVTNECALSRQHMGEGVW